MADEQIPRRLRSLSQGTKDEPFEAPESLESEGATAWQSIVMQDYYVDWSYEELRFGDYGLSNLGDLTIETSKWLNALEDFGHPKKKFSDILESGVFTVVVGTEEKQKVFQVHEGALRNCPVLAGALEPGKWANSETRKIDLSDDDPELFTRLLQYLYNQDFSPPFTRSRFTCEESISSPLSNRQNEAVTLMKLYCLADKYCVDGIKPDIVLKLKYCQPTVTTFFEITNFAYDNLPEETDAFNPLKKWTRSYVIANRPSLVGHEEMRKIVERGGSLAWEMYQTSIQANNENTYEGSGQASDSETDSETDWETSLMQ